MNDANEPNNALTEVILRNALRYDDLQAATMSHTIQLRYLPINTAWAFIFGNTDLVAFDGKRLFSSRDEAVWYAKEAGITVSARGDCATSAVQPSEPTSRTLCAT